MHRAAALACLAILTTACVPEAATSQGRDVAWLYNIFMLASAGVFVIVIGLLTWSIIRYRGQPGRDVEMPTPTRGNVTLEVIWWSLPAALVVVLAVLTVGVLGQVDAREDDPGVVVRVHAFQWGWEFTFPDADVVVSGTSADPPRIELPMGETIAFEITSQDVVHSFWIPRFLIKREPVRRGDRGGGHVRRPVRRVLRAAPLTPAVRDRRRQPLRLRRLADRTAG